MYRPWERILFSLYIAIFFFFLVWGKVRLSCSTSDNCERQSHQELVAFLCRVLPSFPSVKSRERATASEKCWLKCTLFFVCPSVAWLVALLCRCDWLELFKTTPEDAACAGCAFFFLCFSPSFLNCILSHPTCR